MIKYVVKRILLLIPVVLCVMILIFTIMYFVPGDMASIVLGNDATEVAKEAYREKMGLNDPYFVRLFNYVKDIVLHFDFGTSYVHGTSVTADLMERFPRTLIIAAGTVLIGFAIGIPLGILAAVKQNTIVDQIALLISLIGVSMPGFWLALMLVIVFSLNLGWLPPSGIGGFEYYILPCVANAVAGIAGNVRLTRSCMLENIRSDYVVTARSKGLSEFRVLVRHALPNAAIPIITSMGNCFGVMLGGTLIIENVFSIPGIGAYMVKAINNRDYPAVQGSVIFLAVAFGIVMLIVDLLYAFVDPRIKAQYEGKNVG
ncbi:MAG: ABC transporter permease [Clostridiales bacterium]|nr:ABC transporter permease [Clostridiales bacterium]